MSERIFTVSSWSGGNGGNCVEACPPVGEETFRASSYSGPTGGQCLEVDDSLDSEALLRDSKVPGVHIHIGTAAFVAFTEFAGNIARRDYPDA